MAETEFKPEHFINRELSWLEFNQRVLDEALNPKTPLLERVKFFCITSSNLDEFFEVRVAGLKQQIESEVVERSVDGMTATQCFRAVGKRAHQMVEQQFECWREKLAPALARNGIRFIDPENLKGTNRDYIDRFYHEEVRPVLTPLGIDSAHPFPQLRNKSLNLIVQLEIDRDGNKTRQLAIVQVPRALPRLVPLPREDGRMDYVFLGKIIGHYLADIFPGNTVLGFWMFRLTRNSELYIDEEEVANLLKAVEEELHNRRKGAAVRLEVQETCPPVIYRELLTRHNLTENDLYLVGWPINPVRMMTLYEGDHSPELRDPPFVAPVARMLRTEINLFDAIRQRDILLHHPYENFGSVVEFLAQAAEDPRVLAIKQTLYRTGGDQRIVGALMHAVRNGKQVTVVVELRARFDEANNIQWARQLEEAGVHVVYGLVGYKIHAKMTLVVRRDDNGIRRYLHLATGNYNASTARLYTDIGLLTCDADLGEDAANLFNLLTGVCQFQGTRKLLVAPFELHTAIKALINDEAEHARRGLPARIIAKMNSLVDRDIIECLYRASQAGVKIDLVVRGVCCLRPGLTGVSENISVRSIVDRFLEHSRIFYFENACQPKVYVSSADWMPRNFLRRIETVFPISDGNLRDRLITELMDVTLNDNVKARHLEPDGSYSLARQKKGTGARRSQSEFISMTRIPKASKAGGKLPGKDYPKMKLRPRPSPETR